MQVSERTVRLLRNFLVEIRDKLKNSKLYFFSKTLKKLVVEIDELIGDIEYKLLGEIPID